MGLECLWSQCCTFVGLCPNLLTSQKRPARLFCDVLRNKTVFRLRHSDDTNSEIDKKRKVWQLLRKNN